VVEAHPQRNPVACVLESLSLDRRTVVIWELGAALPYSLEFAYAF
jgi:hypothetical protein